MSEMKSSKEPTTAEVVEKLEKDLDAAKEARRKAAEKVTQLERELKYVKKIQKLEKDLAERSAAARPGITPEGAVDNRPAPQRTVQNAAQQPAPAQQRVSFQHS